MLVITTALVVLSAFVTTRTVIGRQIRGRRQRKGGEALRHQD
jgi:ABC-type xylose transport system permease subunit